MKIPLSRAFTFLALAALTDCAAAAGLGFETDERKPAFVHGQLEDLIGSSKEKVTARLGDPQYELFGKSESYFVYQEWVDAAGVIWFILPFPAWGEDVVLRCSMLEFDDDDLVSRFELTGPIHFEVVEQGGPYLPKDCTEMFWSVEELAELKRKTEEVRISELKKRADAGDPEAMYEYAYSRKSNVEAWKWICLAAHSGHGEARWRVGLWYRADYVGPEENLVLAYVWLALSSEAGYAKAKRY